MADQDLISYARDAASRGDDLFALLATDATASESDIRRAFRRKALTAHPDKAGDAYDPALYERLERARDVLTTAAAREAYDNGMRAVLQKKAQLDQMSAKRRQLVEDLERREEEAKRARMGPAPPTYDPLRAALAAKGRAKMEEMRRLREEAEARERLREEAEARQRPVEEKEVFPAATSASSTTATSAGRPSQPASTSTPQPGQPTPPPTDPDDYDERIADLERRLKESQQRKAEKKQRKTEKKAKMDGSQGEVKAATGRGAPAHPLTATDTHPGEDKAPDRPPDAEPPAGNAPSSGDRFAAMHARLREAQAKRNEEKRRKAEAEEAARAAAGQSVP